MNCELYPHNGEAYEKVMAHFNARNRKAAVVHATGTGKSYIAAAVAQHFNKVLVIAPMDIILDETRRAMGYKKDVTFCTYVHVVYNSETMRSDYDLIVLDEYHRSGAEQWGSAVRKLIERNEGAKLLGLSATNIRYLDKYRNMAEEMFDGNIVSELTLGNAMRQNILPTPTLVECIYSFDETEKMLHKRIAEAKRSKAWKANQLKVVERARLSWDKSNGAASIIKKYITSDIHRIILFAKSIEAATNIQTLVSGWFEKAGIRNIHFYQINYKSPTLREDLAAYKCNDDGFEGIKIAIAVNMFNEGVHIDGVDCLIMLRNTISRTMVEQQLGRCLTTGNSGRTPLILDMVNNVKIVYGRRHRNNKALQDEQYDTIYESHRERTCTLFESLPFSIIDETVDIQMVVDNMKDLLTYDECKEIASRYEKRIDIRRGHKECYYRIINSGWHELLPESTRKRRTADECGIEALKYTSRKDFQIGSPALYKWAREHHILDMICVHMTKKSSTKTLEECIEEAKKHNSYTEFHKNATAFYSYVKKHGWIDIIKNLYNKEKKPYRTEEECHEVALRYNTRIEFNKNHPAMYVYARKHGMLDRICSHMKVLHKKRTHDECIKEARQYKTLTELRKKNIALYEYAKKYGWKDDIKKLFKNKRNDRNI